MYKPRVRRRVDNLVVLVWHGICSLPEETLLLFTKLLMSVSDSELEELQEDPPPIESLLRSGRNRLYLNFMTENSKYNNNDRKTDGYLRRLGHVFCQLCLSMD